VVSLGIIHGFDFGFLPKVHPLSENRVYYITFAPKWLVAMLLREYTPYRSRKFEEMPEGFEYFI